MDTDPEPRGLLHVEMDCPAEYVEEFQAWYNTEHVPERLGIPGFVSARRFAGLEGGLRWLALYEVSTPAVLETAAYRHWLGPGETAWTKRILPRKGASRRTVFELLGSDRGGERPAEPVGGPPGLFSLRLSGPADDLAALRATFDRHALLGCPGLDRIRLYRDAANPSDTLLLAELSDCWAVQQPEFQHRWNLIAAELVDRAIDHTRALYVWIL